MTKKSLDKKAKEIIISRRDEGKSDQEIYDELCDQYYDKSGIVWLISSIVTKEKRLQYKTHNNVLIGMLVFGLVLKFLSFPWPFNPILFFALLIGILINVYFIYSINKFEISSYLLVAWFTALSASGVLKQQNPMDIVFSLLFAISVWGLSFYLWKRLQSKIRNIQKTTNGDYIFD